MASLRVQKALSERIYLLQAVQEESEWLFRVRGESSNVYDQRFSATTFHCTCPDHAKRHTFCKHLLYIICRVGNQMDVGAKVSARSSNWSPTAYQACSLSWALRLKHRIAACTEASADNVCAICYEDLDTDASSLVMCVTTCKNRFHKSCMDKWLDAAHDTCPMCRGIWCTDQPAIPTATEQVKGVVLDTIDDTNATATSLSKPDVLFTFDTTGSMYPCLREVQRNIEQVAKKLFAEIPNLRIAVMAHGDYCDKSTTYLTKHLDFTSDVNAVVKFVSEVGSTNGGDYPEAYEYVLRESRKLSWRTDATMKSLVMIGDAPPHEAHETPEKIDWKEEAEHLADRNIQIFSVQCLNKGNRAAYAFYSKIAELTDGYHLFLDQFSYVQDLIEAVCYKQYDVSQLEEFERNVQTRSGGISGPMKLMFDTMLGRKTRKEVAELMSPDTFRARYTTVAATPSSHSTTELKPCAPTKFQVFNVTKDIGIKDFCNEMGIRFKVGRGFYEFTKSELIQEKKEIVLMKKDTGDLYEGGIARHIAGIPEGRAKVSPACLKDYRVFIQSTSATRKLICGQGFLYEVAYD